MTWILLCLDFQFMILAILFVLEQIQQQRMSQIVVKFPCPSLYLRLMSTGFYEGCEGSLTNTEVDMLPMGAKLMTIECGMRFLADYLNGDVYFKIHREKQNLDRARCQFALVADMEKKWDQMKEIVEKYRSNYYKSTPKKGCYIMFSLTYH